MTLPKDVQDAVDHVNHCELHSFDADWVTIFSHLLNQNAEIDRLHTNENLSTLQHNKLLAKYELAEGRLAAADALLRECVHFIDHGGAADDDLAEKIEAHLQGAGDEA